MLTQQKLDCAIGWGLVDLFIYWANPMFKCEGFNQSQEFCVLVAVMPKNLIPL